MRLLNTKSLKLSHPFVPNEIPDYAILSHRWSAEEVTFADLSNASILQLQSQSQEKHSIEKLQGACALALREGYEWIWVDSCCIDKSSSAELQESINSMWRYYADSCICYVYLADVPDSKAGWGPLFAQSEWFTRGWTLQELIAPVCVEFYAGDWTAIGTKFERYEQIAEITSINPGVLVRTYAINLVSVAEKLSWASHRNVTRGEDEAYSLLGVFDVNMPLLYGEGREKAFVRLQEAIYNTTADQSIFLFRHSQHTYSQPLLADSPSRFCDRIDCALCLSRGFRNTASDFRYRNIVASAGWSRQAHEQIMTTVTTLRNLMSTVLPLLAYQDVSTKLVSFDKYTALRPTHVAILNRTLEQYPRGRFCLLLYRWLNSDECLRLQVLPSIVPNHRDFVAGLQKTKLLICLWRPKDINNDDGIDFLFSVNSGWFRVESWSAKGTINHSTLSAQAGPNSDFKIQARKHENSTRLVQVSCRMSTSQDPKQWLTIHLVRMHGIWSIREVFEPEKSDRERKLRTLFRANIPADRCSIRFSDGEAFSVKVRRLPSPARARGEGVVLRKRYQISVDR